MTNYDCYFRLLNKFWTFHNCSLLLIILTLCFMQRVIFFAICFKDNMIQQMCKVWKIDSSEIQTVFKLKIIETNTRRTYRTSVVSKIHILWLETAKRIPKYCVWSIRWCWSISMVWRIRNSPRPIAEWDFCLFAFFRKLPSSGRYRRLWSSGRFSADGFQKSARREAFSTSEMWFFYIKITWVCALIVTNWLIERIFL